MQSLADDQDANQRGFFQRFGFVLGIVGLGLIVGIIFIGRSLSHTSGAKTTMPEVTMVKIVVPPAPPPPPPPPPPKLVEEKMEEQMPVDANESKPDDAPAPTPDLGTSITGSGSDGFGLSANRGGTQIGSAGRRGGGSRFGWYAAEVQNSIGDALRRNAHTRDASFRLEVRVWPDLTGRITRATITGTTGDRALDNALRDEVLTGLQLKTPPPEGMPLPIVMRVTARRPN